MARNRNRQQQATFNEPRPQAAPTLGETIEFDLGEQSTEQPDAMPLVDYQDVQQASQVMADSIEPEPAAVHESRPAAVLANIRARFDATTCPKCGAERFWVARTKPTDEGQLRERHCKTCGHIGQAIQPPERPV